MALLGALFVALEARHSAEVLMTPAGWYKGLMLTLGKLLGEGDWMPVQSQLGMLLLTGVMFFSMLINATCQFPACDRPVVWY